MRKFLDDRRRELLFGPAPKRVVSLVPSDTLSLADLGVGHTLVGCTEYCELPTELVGALPKVGGTKNPSIEAILALEPDLVLANQEENTKSDLQKLATAGVRVYIAFPQRAADGLAHLARLARIFQVERAPAVVELLRRGYHALAQAEREEDVARMRVFCPIWMTPLMTIHGSTVISDMLRLAGADNVFADRERRYPLAADLGQRAANDAEGRDVRYPRVTLEEVVARAPQLILLPNEPHPFSAEDAAVFADAFASRPTPPRIEFCDGKDLCWYGSRTVDALPRLRRLVHGTP